MSYWSFQEIDRLKALLKNKEADHVKVQAALDDSVKETNKLNKKLEKQKEEADGAEIKVKWAQNKLKTELDAHKETKKQVTILDKNLSGKFY